MSAHSTVGSIKYTSQYCATYVAQHDAKSCEDLPEHDQSSSNIGGSAFRGVDRDGSTLWSITKAQQKSKADHHAPILRKSLCKTRDDREKTGCKDRTTATQQIIQRMSEPEPRSDRSTQSWRTCIPTTEHATEVRSTGEKTNKNLISSDTKSINIESLS